MRIYFIIENILLINVLTKNTTTDKDEIMRIVYKYLGVVCNAKKTEH